MEQHHITSAGRGMECRQRGTKDYRFVVIAASCALSLVFTTPVTVSATEEEFQSKAEKAADRTERSGTLNVERRIRSEDEIEIEGVVIDRTKTPTGRRFYQEFSADWVENLSGAVARANLVIEERPSRSSTSLLTIRDDQDTLYSTVLTPRIVGIQETAEEAAATVRQRLILKAISRSNEEQEIEKDLIGEGY